MRKKNRKRKKKHVHNCFTDLQKAFDSTRHEVIRAMLNIVLRRKKAEAKDPKIIVCENAKSAISDIDLNEEKLEIKQENVKTLYI